VAEARGGDLSMHRRASGITTDMSWQYPVMIPFTMEAERDGQP
jgi:hypothetical protein